MRTINTEQIVLFHRKIINETGGSNGVRDISLVESALKKSQMTFGGKDLYEGLYKKIATTTYALIKNHGFVDGNKRIGVATMLLLTKLNGITLSYSQEELVELGLKTASGELSEEDIEHWIVRHQVAKT